ncbi:uracil-DNA glycosylase [Patescibacteria group bacterium]|nr:uracil-DNA glycosylase [Patescibacteria group bacterium]
MDSLNNIAEEVQNCHKCALAQGRTKTVPGTGADKSEIMFIGEGPGKEEDKQGLPFVGSAGKFLDELLTTINLSRSDVYIGNIVKCRPPQNRDPLPEEVNTCFPYLQKQIAVIKPKLIVLLGRHSMYQFLPENLKISQVHGQAFRRQGQVYLPLYHPAAALYHGSLRDTIINDFKKIPLILKKV